MARPTDQPPLLLAALALVAVVDNAAGFATALLLHPTEGHAAVFGEQMEVCAAGVGWLWVLWLWVQTYAYMYKVWL